MAKAYCLYAGSDGRSRIAVEPLQLALEPGGRLSLSMAGARGWMYGETPEARFVDWHRPGSGGLSVMLEGSMEIEAGDGQICTVLPGDLLFALDTTGQGHRTRTTPGSRGLSIALEGDTAELMRRFFGRVLTD